MLLRAQNLKILFVIDSPQESQSRQKGKIHMNKYYALDNIEEKSNNLKTGSMK